jgi:thymidylate synthase ThyX
MTFEELLSLTDKQLIEKFPYPYVPEKFTPKEKKVLLQFFTNYDQPIYAIFGLPQEVIGAMFSRYSRSAKSVRRLFLDEFWNSELSLKSITSVEQQLQKAQERTQNFYKRVFAEYGDDSVIQMGSVHIAFEYVSQICVKAIEDQRVASAYIEKSTRYVDFGSKMNQHFLYTQVPEIVNSKFYKKYLAWNEFAFHAYIKNLPIVQNYFRKLFPISSQVFENPESGEKVDYKQISIGEEKVKAEKAYERALRARSFDSIRYFLPLTMVSNLGAHFSGQAAENTLTKMLATDNEETRFVAAMAYKQLMKVSPNFIQHINHPFGKIARDYRRALKNSERDTSFKWTKKLKPTISSDVTLIDFDSDADVRVASQVLFAGRTDSRLSKKTIFNWAKKVKSREIAGNKKRGWSPTLEKIIAEAVPNRSGNGLNRRHKLSRAFEQAYVEVEFVTDYGVYKDLQRNRLSSTQKVTFTPEKLTIPKEYKSRGMKKVLTDYLTLAKMTKKLHKDLVASGDERLLNAAEYIVLHGNKVRFSVRANLRQWVFFAELRTISGGHPSYRRVMQKAAYEIVTAMPFTKALFANVDWKRDYGLGRLKAEVWTQVQLAKIR